MVLISFSHTQFQLATLNINKEHKTVESSCLLAYKDPISFLIIRANGPTCRVNGPRANEPDTAKDLFLSFFGHFFLLATVANGTNLF
jgi:hypothetical protein